jgi:protein-tyrosine phosphatase
MRRLKLGPISGVLPPKRAGTHIALCLSLALLPVLAAAGEATPGVARVAGAATAPSSAPTGIVADYDRLLPLAGGSNFRDMGGLFTADGREVRRGVLYRSGAMSSLTAADQAYLGDFGFRRVVDLRSTDERALYPNHWAAQQDIPVSAHDYDMLQFLSSMVDENGEPRSMAALYETMPESLQPQLRLFFSALLQAETPLVVNCSAGQDRTGLASALLLLTLGVPREVVVQDYLSSTRYRRPLAERGDVDLAAAAEDNAFARVMLRYGADQREPVAEPLLTAEGVPYLHYALETIARDYGSVAAYLEQALGVSAAEQDRLRGLYLR